MPVRTRRRSSTTFLRTKRHDAWRGAMPTKIFPCRSWRSCGASHDVLTTAESGRAGQANPDAGVLAFSITAQRAGLTLKPPRFIPVAPTNTGHQGEVGLTDAP